MATAPLRIFVTGATGTIGRAVAATCAQQGYETVCLIRRSSRDILPIMEGMEVREGNATDAKSFAEDGLRGEPFDVLISCLASRNGSSEDAWRIDYRANLDILEAAKSAGIKHFILLSAICVQRPMLQFQFAKLAFEKALIESGMKYSIVRPTAFFKSLSGQVARVKKGRPFLMFGDGEVTSCKPISDADLAEYIVGCIAAADRHDRILPIGGPGNAITPREQGEMLFSLLGREPKFRRVPIRFMDVVIATLRIGGTIVPALGRKAELARIGRYYATQSMLAINPTTGEYDADATPATGKDTLYAHYQRLIACDITADLGAHAVF
jgi:divinyl chlorophyllide a 8-vinyl-reductase